jgi:hypothetical protein
VTGWFEGPSLAREGPSPSGHAGSGLPLHTPTLAVFVAANLGYLVAPAGPSSPGSARASDSGLDTGTDNPRQRLVAALLCSVPRVLSAEASRRSLAGQPREEICAMLADVSTRAFDLLEPSLGSYGIRPPGGS